jgi:hypothetical protein
VGVAAGRPAAAVALEPRKWVLPPSLAPMFGCRRLLQMGCLHIPCICPLHTTVACPQRWLHPPPATPPCRRAGGLLSRLQARVLQRMLAVGVQYVQVEVADVEVQYCQVGAGGCPGVEGRSMRTRPLLRLAARCARVSMHPPCATR